MTTSNVVLQKNAISPIRSFCLFVESLQLLNVDLCIECLVALKWIIMNYAFPVSPYTQHDHSKLKVLFSSRSRSFVGAEPFVQRLHFDVKDNGGKESAISDRALSDVERVVFVVFA